MYSKLVREQMRDTSHSFSSLSGKIAAITGGAGELCSTMASALAEQGVKVALIDLDGKRAQSLAEEIQEHGGQALGIGASVLERQDLEGARDIIRSEWGGLHILINGAGGNQPGATTSEGQSFFDLSAEAIRKVMDLNFMGTFLPCQVLGKLLLETVKEGDQEGNIINISSMNAFRPLTRIPAYSAAKAAVSNFTQWLAVHMAGNYTPNIRVNAIAPGFFLTAQNRFLLTEEATGGLTARGRTIITHTPAGRLGKSEDLISTLFWLLDPKSSFITGAVVPVDGGFNAFSGV